jgi:amino acid transporter
VPDGSAIVSILITAIGMTFMAIAYAGLIAAMPRAGGDYVWQTRILDGIPAPSSAERSARWRCTSSERRSASDGTVTLVARRWVLVAGARSASSAAASASSSRRRAGGSSSRSGRRSTVHPEDRVHPAARRPCSAGSRVSTSSDARRHVRRLDPARSSSTSALVALGMAGYARIQRWCLYIGLAALAVIFVLMVDLDHGPFIAAYNREASRSSASDTPTRRRSTRARAQAWNGGDVDTSRSAPARSRSCPFMLFFLLYPNWGSTLYGEVRGAGDFRKVLNGMLGGLWVTVGLAIVFVFLAAKTFGWEFFNASNATYVNYAYGYTPMTPRSSPIWGFPGCSPRT